MQRPRRFHGWILACAVALLVAGCGGDEPGEAGARRGGAPGGGRGAGFGGPGGPGERGPAAAVPVETATVERRDISSFIETHGTLEAENEVDIVARASAPIVDLRVEEGMAVRRGQILARLEEDELRAQLEVARVTLEDARLAWERAQTLSADQLISTEEFEQAKARFETAEAQLRGNEIQLGYTVVTAPFDGLIVGRYVDFAQQVTPGTPLFRLSDFNPLLCPIQVPERDMARVSVGQRAFVQVEAYGDRQFDARVLRVRPVVDAATGTVRVTLEVDSAGKLRPGMFARVFVEVERRAGTLVVPKAALSLDSIGDTVYVVGEGVAARREVELGFREGDSVEVLAGLAEGETVVVVGQDGLSDGTPIQVLGGAGAPGAVAPAAAGEIGGPAGAEAGGPAGPRAGGGPPPGFDPSQMTPERLERMKQRMRDRGMTEEQIEQRLEQLRRQRESGGQ